MNVCVFCSSSDSIAEKYKLMATDFGKWLAEYNLTLVYGGATGGLMDAVAKGAFEGGAEIIGVVPRILIEKNRLSKFPSQLVKVGSMAERKSEMKALSDAFVVLPGGYGTLDELFDVYAASIVGEHDKPIFVFNPDDYWKGIIMQCDRFLNEGTAHKSSVNTLKFFNDLDELKKELISIK